MTYMDKIRAIQAKVRACVPLTDAETKTIREYASRKANPRRFQGDVHAWCEKHDSRAPEDWLYLVLDGTYSIEEMRAAILENRTPREGQ